MKRRFNLDPGFKDPAQVDQILLDDIRAVLRGRTEPLTMLALCEELAKRSALDDGQAHAIIEVDQDVRLYFDHPTRKRVAECVCALVKSGELQQLMKETRP